MLFCSSYIFGYMLLLLSFFSSSIKFKFKISFICVIIRYKLLPILFSNLMTMQLIKSSSVWFKESLKEKKSCVITTIPKEFVEADGNSTGF